MADTRIDSLILILETKHGMKFPEKVTEDAYDNEDAREIAGLPKKEEEKKEETPEAPENAA